MHGTRVLSYGRNSILIAATAVALSACLMGEEKAKSDEEIAADNQLVGSVGDGPVVGATIKVRDNNGEVLAEILSDENASFDVTVRTKGRNYPLTVAAIGGTDLVTIATPDFDMSSAVLQPGKKTVANINPFTTIALETARELPGGLTKENIETAEAITVTALSSGLTTLIGTGPMRTTIDASNIAEIVKSSETLGEIIRRTRDMHLMFSRPASGNQVLRALSSDLTDALIDGRGATRTEPRTSALATVIATLVYLESMQNELHVNGQDATAAMDAAIMQTTASTAPQLVADIRVTEQMILAVRLGLSAILAVGNNAKIAELDTAFAGVQSGMDAVLIKTLIPADYRQTLESAIQSIAGADDSVIDTINTISRTGVSEPEVNQPPSISGAPAISVVAGSNYSFTPSATDPEGAALTFSITNRPSWASFNTTSGALSGTPTTNDVASYNNIIISVSDGDLSAALPTFSITVTRDNSAPTISGTPQTQVIENSSYSFTPTASDPDGDTLTFSIAGQPTWASFNTTTGQLSGTPGSIDVGSHGGIVISVSDGQLSNSMAAFMITVTQAPVTNSAPTISGTPQTQVNANSSYSFSPTASDPDGDPLSFTISGLPAWASFNSSNGTVSGTPTDANVGTYSDIRITVSDGILSATLAPFTITVSAVSLGSVTLNWTPPTENEDGTPLMDLAGYRFYWGTTPGNYTDSVTIDNPGLTSYVVDNLVPGTYEFVATSINASGVESVYSNPATKVVN